MNHKQAKTTVRTFALASFLNDFGSDMIYPLWPLFLTQVLGVNMALLGLIDGLGDALVSISQAVSGYWSDRLRKRKIFIWTGYLLSATSRFGYAISQLWPTVLLFRIIDRSGKMRDTPRDAIVADASSVRNRGANFGFIRSMDHLGAVCGILVSIFLIHYIPIRTIFMLAAIPTFLGALGVYLFIRKDRSQKNLYAGMRLKDLSGRFKGFLFLSGVFSLGSFSYSFLLIFAKQFGFASTSLPILYLILTITAFISSYPFGRLADFFGRKSILFIGFALWGITTFTLIGWQTSYAIYAAFIFYGLSRGAVETVQKAFVSEIAPQAYRASGLGTFKMVVGFSALPASLMAGALWDRTGIFTPFYVSLLLTIVAAVMLLFISEK